MAIELDLDDAVANTAGSLAREEVYQLHIDQRALVKCLKNMVEHAECNDPSNPYLATAQTLIQIVGDQK